MRQKIKLLCVLFFIFFLNVFLSKDLFAMSRKPDVFAVQVKVDFGPAGKKAHQETVYVEEGTTPKEAVSQLFPVMSGKTCCSYREIMEIGGVRVDPAKNRWWMCYLNGSAKVSPQKKKLKKGDIIEWVYIQDEQ